MENEFQQNLRFAVIICGKENKRVVEALEPPLRLCEKGSSIGWLPLCGLSTWEVDSMRYWTLLDGDRVVLEFGEVKEFILHEIRFIG